MGHSQSDAEAYADEWMASRAALHGPDQVAGGGRTAGDTGRAGVNDENDSSEFRAFRGRTGLIGMGDARINSSIGSQWRTRIRLIDTEVNKTKYTPELKQRLNMNVVLAGREI
jgi:hypothetical protein